MNLLLIGEVYSDNLGDQIIRIITEKVIKEMYPTAQLKFLDIMGRYAYCSTYQNNNNINSKSTSVQNLGQSGGGGFRKHIACFAKISILT